MQLFGEISFGLQKGELNIPGQNDKDETNSFLLHIVLTRNGTESPLRILAV